LVAAVAIRDHVAVTPLLAVDTAGAELRGGRVVRGAGGRQRAGNCVGGFLVVPEGCAIQQEILRDRRDFRVRGAFHVVGVVELVLEECNSRVKTKVIKCPEAKALRELRRCIGIEEVGEGACRIGDPCQSRGRESHQLGVREEAVQPCWAARHRGPEKGGR
jgi:hypothetical protein